MALQLGYRSYIDKIDYRNTANGDVTVGNWTGIARGLRIISGVGTMHPSKTHPQVVSNYSFAEWLGEPAYIPSLGNQGIRIGHDVWIGADVMLIDGIEIGNGAIIGAGAVVARSIPPYAVAVGVPAKPVKFRFTPEQIEKLEKIAWWNWPEEKVRGSLNDMKNIVVFLEKYGN